MTEVVAASAGETHPVISSSRPVWTRVGWVLAGSVILAGVVLRFLVQSDLWLDEALTLNIAELPLDQLREALVHDGAPPLSYVLLHVWVRVFGDGDVAVRALSGVLGVAAIGLAYLVAARLGRAARERRWLGLSSAVVIASSPYAIHYSTEVRMYALSMVLVFMGAVVGRFAWDAPTPVRLAGVALVTAALLYTQYWSFFLVGVVGLALVAAGQRGTPTTRRRARRILVAMVSGCSLFVPWIPTLREQLAHTGTPWDSPASPLHGTTQAVQAFAGGHDLAAWGLLIALAALGARGLSAGRDNQVANNRVASIRAASMIAAGTLLLGVLVSTLLDVGFQDRYAAVVFPIVPIVGAAGLLSVPSLAMRGAALAVVATLGLVGGLQVIRAERTASGVIARTLRPLLARDDVVAYCPDQLGPSTERILPAGTRQVTYPELASPRFVDWTDYADRHANASPERFATRVDDRAGSASVWLIWSPGYRTLGTACERVVNEFERIRPDGEIERVADGPNHESVELRRFDR